MIGKHDPMDLVTRMSEAAATASERFVPRSVRAVMDRTIVDMACVATGGIHAVARDLNVDVPAVNAWRSLGVPSEFRARVTAMTVWPRRWPAGRPAARRCWAAA